LPSGLEKTTAAPKEPEPDAAAAAAAAPEVPPEEEVSYAPTFVPQIKAELPADLDERERAANEAVATATAARRELREKLSSGDLGVAEFDEAVEALTNQSAEAQRILAEIAGRRQAYADAQAYNEQQSQQAWETTVNAFVKAHGVYKSEGMQAQLADAIRQVSNREDAAGKSYDWHLREAHQVVAKQMKESFGIDIGSASGTKAPPAGPPTNPDGTLRRDVNVRQQYQAPVPQTLAQAPTAGDATPANPHVDPKFANIDSLTGMEYELALASMDESTSREYGDTSRLHH
jgi:hypothetical protein